jgi:excisionase family DNA binding protein
MLTPLAYSVPNACSVSGSGRTKIYEAINSGELRAVKHGRRTLILAEDLQRWLQSLPSFAVSPTRQSSTATPYGVMQEDCPRPSAVRAPTLPPVPSGRQRKRLTGTGPPDNAAACSAKTQADSNQSGKSQ